MKKISRAKLRGKPLDEDCKKANRTTHEYGLNDNRIYCYGLEDPMYDEPLEKCKNCKAFVNNIEPLKECEDHEERRNI